ncbi:MAG: hypothetical protein IT378_01570 [Sandaracinaceae bacterium]|nr:hypothetical protein [Sandaracinaceae bacterium]
MTACRAEVVVASLDGRREDHAPLHLPMVAQELINDLAAMGATPVTASSPAEIAVSVDSSLGAPTTQRASCSGGASLQLCEDADLRITRRALDASLVVRFATRDLVAQSLSLEIVRGSTAARVFVREDTDAAPPGLPRVCPVIERVSVSGTLALSTTDLSVPDAVHGVLVVELAGGGAVTLPF